MKRNKTQDPEVVSHRISAALSELDISIDNPHHHESGLADDNDKKDNDDEDEDDNGDKTSSEGTSVSSHSRLGRFLTDIGLKGDGSVDIFN